METQKNIYKALAAFQQEAPIIHKETQGYGYKFADLPTIFETINPLLKKHGLGFTQLIQGNAIQTIVFHTETGEHIISLANIPQNVELKGQNPFQVLGSAITYLRRYSLSAALGLVTDVDNDAAGEIPKKVNTPQQAKEWANTPGQSEKKWLNVYSDKEKTTFTKEWENAVAKLEAGEITVKQIQEHYKLNKEVFAQLTEIENFNKAVS